MRDAGPEHKKHKESFRPNASDPKHQKSHLETLEASAFYFCKLQILECKLQKSNSGTSGFKLQISHFRDAG